VRNPTGKVVAAVNAFGPSFRFPARGRQQLAAQAVVATAALCALFYSQDKSDFSEKHIRLQSSSKITNTDPLKKLNLAISGSRHQCLFILGSAGAFNWHLLLHC